MTTITIRQRTAAGTQSAGNEYLQRVTSLFGTVVDEFRPYFGQMSLDHAGLSVRDRAALDADVVRLTRM